MPAKLTMQTIDLALAGDLATPSLFLAWAAGRKAGYALDDDTVPVNEVCKDAILTLLRGEADGLRGERPGAIGGVGRHTYRSFAIPYGPVYLRAATAFLTDPTFANFLADVDAFAEFVASVDRAISAPGPENHDRRDARSPAPRPQGGRPSLRRAAQGPTLRTP
ncbi:MAG: hypothetical protein JWO38_7676 [Gemmataceae bacterium]|nr:hypothetical protein [Gemmataceae bacterium]